MTDSETVRQVRDDRVWGGIFGLACGDALGVALEFEEPEDARKADPLRDFVGGGPFGFEPGEWSDDTAMTLGVAEGLGRSPHDPGEAIGDAFLRWYHGGPKDIGGTVRVALRAYDAIRDWQQASAEVRRVLGDKTAGNGSLMRTLPVALVYGDREEIVRKAKLISDWTHPHPLARWSCILYCLLVRDLYEGVTKEEAWNRLVKRSEDGDELFGNIEEHEVPELLKEAIKEVPTLPYEEVPSGGYVLETFQAALWAWYHKEGLEEAIVTAANMGGDADTVAAVTGGLVGVAYGYDSIPSRWLERLRHKDELERACQQIMSARRALGYSQP